MTEKKGKEGGTRTELSFVKCLLRVVIISWQEAFPWLNGQKYGPRFDVLARGRAGTRVPPRVMMLTCLVSRHCLRHPCFLSLGTHV